MRATLVLSAVILSTVLPLPARASGFSGAVEFTAEEKATHQRDIGTITRQVRRYLEVAFYRRYDVSKYCGNRSTSAASDHADVWAEFDLR